ncbi:MAG: hypothetical protein COA69_11285 [Robiginitomaculum sp.]|nr:MAG: hypothetical protein COA69_11285 [Robiginitomaculum sp.]
MSHMKKYSLLSLTVLVVSGCAHMDKAALNLQISDARSAVPVVWQVEGVGEDVARAQGWAGLFVDPVLSRYIHTAEQENFDIDQARLRVAQSEALLARSRGGLLPQITGNVQVNGSAPLDDLDVFSDSYGSGISARWNPDIFGGLKAGVRQSQASLEAQKASARDVRQAVLASVVRAYIRVIEADLLLDLATTNLTFLEETNRISNARFRAGDIGGDDLALSDLAYQSSVSSLRNQEFARREAGRALSILLGGFGADDLEVADHLPAPLTLPVRGVPGAVLDTRPDLQALQARILASFASYEGVVANDWPSLGLSGSIGGNGADLGDLFDPAHYIAALGASLVGTLFDGGQNKALRDGAKLAFEESLNRYGKALRQAMREIESAYDQDSSLQRSLVALREASTAADEALRLEQIKYDLGESILLDVLTIQRRVNAANASRISTERARLDAQIAAFVATGGEIPVSR